MTSQLYALILAGGSGERFWPLSRKSRPKQLLSLFSERTLLESTLARSFPLPVRAPRCPIEHFYAFYGLN